MQTKAFILATCCALWLVSGCSHPSATTTHSHAGHPHNDVATHKEPNESSPHGLVLNNGAKWQADESTRAQAAAIIAHIESFESAHNPDLPAHHGLAQKAQEEIDALIAGCRMKGKEHDALHLWLEPVMADVKTLHNAGTVRDAQAASRKLSGDAKKFNQFFN